MKQVLLVGIGGFFGSGLRYLISISLQNRIPDWPLGTLSVNLIGCLLIGILAGGLSKSNDTVHLLLAVGFCGGFTTFSAFALDGAKLINAHNWLIMLGYSSLSVVGGLILCFLGLWIGNKLA